MMASFGKLDCISSKLDGHGVDMNASKAEVTERVAAKVHHQSIITQDFIHNDNS